MTITVVLLSCKPCDKVFLNDSIYVNNIRAQLFTSWIALSTRFINHYPVHSAIMVSFIVIYRIAIYPVDITIDPGLHTVFE